MQHLTRWLTAYNTMGLQRYRFFRHPRKRARWGALAAVGALGAIFSAHAIPQSERDVLSAFYVSTNGASWADKSGWNGPAGTECAWYGITCSDDGANVTQIFLRNNGLSGRLPSNLNALNKLQHLLVMENQIAGNVPSLAGLRELRTLLIDSNRLTGALPPLTGLTALQFFYVSNNQLEGALPSLIDQQSMLIFQVQNNRFTGTIPTAPPLLMEGNSSLCPNPLTATPDAAWDAATQGTVWSTLCGTIPTSERNTLLALYNSTNGPAWANRSYWNGNVGSECGWYGVRCSAGNTHVIELNLGGNGLTGALPVSLNQLTELQVLNLQQNEISGAIPSLSGLSKLRVLNTERNQISGNLPALSGLTALQELRINDNQLSGSLRSFAGLGALQYFYAQSNLLTGGMPTLADASALIEFSVGNNRLTGAIPSLQTLTSLRQFRVEGNALTGAPPTAPPSLIAEGSALCPNQLDYVASDNANNAAWNAATPGSVWQSQCITIPLIEREALLSLYSATNGTHGTFWNIPTNWGGDIGTECTWFGVTCNATQRNVIRLELNNNGLNGNLPPNLNQLKKLQFFAAQNNQLRGPLPSFSGMTDLVIFDLANNLLTGAIPPLASLPSLSIFILTGNSLTGPLPSLSGLPALQGLLVSGNQLSGSLPAPPLSLARGLSELCPNQFTPDPSAAWDTATVGALWSTGCTLPLQSQTLTFGPAPPLFAGGTAIFQATASPTVGSTPIIYTSLTPTVCSINPTTGIASAATASGTAGRVCTIAADKAGDAGFNTAPQIQQSTTVLAQCRLDVNGDQRLTADVDGVLIMRYLHGFRGTALTAGLPLAGFRTTPETIISFLESQNFDVRGFTPPSSAVSSRDGLAILRHLSGSDALAMVAGTGIDNVYANTVKTRVVGWCAP
jgi:Leucine-rich repeat (LRR) protein